MYSNNICQGEGEVINAEQSWHNPATLWRPHAWNFNNELVWVGEEGSERPEAPLFTVPRIIDPGCFSISHNLLPSFPVKLEAKTTKHGLCTTQNTFHRAVQFLGILPRGWLDR